MAPAALRDRLFRFLESKVPGQAVLDQTPLLTSGLLDSLALIDLLLWIEEEIAVNR